MLVENKEPQSHTQSIDHISFAAEQKGGAARVMSEAYNESCGDWSN
jgi:hypothetical protein